MSKYCNIILSVSLFLFIIMSCSKLFCQTSFHTDTAIATYSFKNSGSRKIGSYKRRKVFPEVIKDIPFVFRDSVNHKYDTGVSHMIISFGRYIDSLHIIGEDFEILHYHEVSYIIKEKMRLDSCDNIFNDSLNQYSRLIFKKDYNSFFNVPTIPLTHIVYLESQGLIVGLSKFEASPYHIVIYSEDGKLLSKRTLYPYELKASKDELKKLLQVYPKKYKCLCQSVIVKKNDTFLLESTRCLSKIIKKDGIFGKFPITSSQYFPWNVTAYEGLSYDVYRGTFSDTNPVDNLITVGSVPYLLILNSKDGRKVNIPLVSNCNLEEELK